MSDSGVLIIFQSTDCETWDPVKVGEIPEWVKDPDILARMVDGEAVQKTDIAETWYIAKRVEVTPEQLGAALEREAQNPTFSGDQKAALAAYRHKRQPTAADAQAIQGATEKRIKRRERNIIRAVNGGYLH